jgi:phosphohistidine phosphatase
MRELLLMRHAKSSWDEPALRDHDRPLNRRGQLDAARIGRLLRDEGIAPDVVAFSTAERASQTVELLIDGLDEAVDARVVPELYLASPQDCVQVASSIPSECQRLLIVAHNPGLEELVASLSGRAERFPTAALARFEVDLDDWGTLSLSTPARMTALWRPKEL